MKPQGAPDRFVVHDLLGYVAVRTWIEPRRSPDGSLELIGMGETRRYDGQGQLIEVKTGPTGVAGKFA